MKINIKIFFRKSKKKQIIFIYIYTHINKLKTNLYTYFKAFYMSLWCNVL